MGNGIKAQREVIKMKEEKKEEQKKIAAGGHGAAGVCKKSEIEDLKR